MVQLLKYWFTRQFVTLGGDIAIPKMTNGIVVVNTGNTMAFVNGFPLHPTLVPGGANGESWTIGGNLGEVLAEEQLEITFGTGSTPQVFVSMKYYVEKC